MTEHVLFLALVGLFICLHRSWSARLDDKDWEIQRLLDELRLLCAEDDDEDEPRHEDAPPEGPALDPVV